MKEFIAEILALIITAIFFILLIILLSLFTNCQSIQKNKIEKIVTITASCPNICCQGKWAYMMTDSEMMGDYKDIYGKFNYNIAASDFSIIPYKSMFIYEGKLYVVMDCGSKIKGNMICLLFDTHEEVIKLGKKENQMIEILK